MPVVRTQETCADCGWQTIPSWFAAGSPAEERDGAAALERAQRAFDAVAAARVSPADGRYLPYIRGGPPSDAEWAAALRAAATAVGATATADDLWETIQRRIAELPDDGWLSVVEVGVAGIATTTVHADGSGAPGLLRGPTVPWTELAPMLPDSYELRFRLAGGFGGTDRIRLWSTLDGAVPAAAAVPAHHQTLLVCTAPGWPVPERALQVLARQHSETSPSRIAGLTGGGMAGGEVAAMVSRAAIAASLRGKLELVVASVNPRTGRVTLRSEQLFGAGAAVGTERELTVWCAHTDDEGTVLAVVNWQGNEPRVVSIDSVPLPPGSHRLRAVLAAPGRVTFVEPPGVAADKRPWSQLMAKLPPRLVPPVVELDLLCALDLSGDGFEERRSLVSELVEVLRQEYPEPGKFQIAIVGYRDHDFRIGVERHRVVRGAWLAPPAEAQRLLDRFRAVEPHPLPAAPVEDALHQIARRVDRIPGNRKVVLLTVGDRPPHPPREGPDGVLACPHQYNWRALLSRIERRCRTSLAVLDSGEHVGTAWQRLGRTALHRLDKTDAHRLATAAGLLVPPADRLSFPFLEPPEWRGNRDL
jgi:hypothetical protein